MSTRWYSPRSCFFHVIEKNPLPSKIDTNWTRSSWWFQTPLKNISPNGNLPHVGVKIMTRFTGRKKKNAGSFQMRKPTWGFKHRFPPPESFKTYFEHMTQQALYLYSIHLYLYIYKAHPSKQKQLYIFNQNIKTLSSYSFTHNIFS